MRYALLIYGNEAIATANQTSEVERAAYATFHHALSERSLLLGDEVFHPTYTATTIRIRNGKLLISDGPFAETKEQLGEIYLLDCKDLDDVIEIAAKYPDARTGSVEIRPILEWR